jgi:hypothetical protein
VLGGQPFPYPPARDLHTMRLVEACATERATHVAPPAGWAPAAPRETMAA